MLQNVGHDSGEQRCFRRSCDHMRRVNDICDSFQDSGYIDRKKVPLVYFYGSVFNWINPVVWKTWLAKRRRSTRDKFSKRIIVFTRKHIINAYFWSHSEPETRVANISIDLLSVRSWRCQVVTSGCILGLPGNATLINSECKCCGQIQFQM